MNVLVFIAHYLPGFKSGGPVKTLKNMVDNLNIKFHIVTLDHDIDGTKYNLPTHEWLDIYGSKVYYVSKKDIDRKFFKKIIQNCKPDFIYLNSFFDSVFSSKFIWLNHIEYLFEKDKILVAARGEFGENALKIKSFKKKIYINIVNILNVYSEIKIQASNLMESEDIKEILKCKEIRIASDIPDKIIFKKHSDQKKYFKILHLARIAEIKNLIFCLKTLSLCKSQVIFDIYGPIEDQDYWDRCLIEIEKLPKNITVNYFGNLDPIDFEKTLPVYNLLFLPSLGENFCHVIAECFSYGIPVLISDKTPWKGLYDAGLGWDLPLDNIQRFIKVIDEFDKTEICSLSKEEIYENYINYFDFDTIIKNNYQLFHNL